MGRHGLSLLTPWTWMQRLLWPYSPHWVQRGRCIHHACTQATNPFCAIMLLSQALVLHSSDPILDQRHICFIKNPFAVMNTKVLKGSVPSTLTHSVGARLGARAH